MVQRDQLEVARPAGGVTKKAGCAGGAVAVLGFVLFWANMRGNWSYAITVASLAMMPLGTALALLATTVAIIDRKKRRERSSWLLPLGATVTGLLLLLLLRLLVLLGRQ